MEPIDTLLAAFIGSPKKKREPNAGEDVGVGVGVDIGAGVAIEFGFGMTSGTPLFQIKVLPDFMQVNFLLAEI